MECCKWQRVHYDLSLALNFFRGVGRENEVPSSIFSAGGGGGETSQSHHDYTVWNEYSPAKNVRFYFKPVYIFKVHRIINGFRLLVCYRVSRNRHFFFNFTRISNLIRGHKYWITLYCNKVGFLFSLFLLNLRLVSGLPLKYQIRGICFYKGLLHQQRPWVISDADNFRLCPTASVNSVIKTIAILNVDLPFEALNLIFRHT